MNFPIVCSFFLIQGCSIGHREEYSNTNSKGQFNDGVLFNNNITNNCFTSQTNTTSNGCCNYQLQKHKHKNGNVTSITIDEIISLPAKASLTVYYTSIDTNNRTTITSTPVQGILSLSKL